jgi:hypothetical protein
MDCSKQIHSQLSIYIYIYIYIYISAQMLKRTRKLINDTNSPEGQNPTFLPRNKIVFLGGRRFVSQANVVKLADKRKLKEC